MKATSIHVRPVTYNSETHNKREKKLSYVREELTPLNEYWQAESQSDRHAKIVAKYTASTGQKWQAKSKPIREGVIVIKEDTTMEDLKELARRYKEELKIDCFQIAIHKDEGHIKAKDWKPNLHAHMVFDWTDEKGKNVRLKKADMAKMQTLASEVLGMARGISSDKKHLSPEQYKAQKAIEDDITQKQEEKLVLSKQVSSSKAELLQVQEELEEVKEEVQEHRAELKGKAKSAFVNIATNMAHSIIGKSKKQIEEQNRQIESLVQAKLAPIVNEYNLKGEQLKEREKALEIEKQSLSQELKATKELREKYETLTAKVTPVAMPTIEDAKTIELLRDVNPKIDEDIAIISDARAINMTDDNIKAVLKGQKIELPQGHKIENGIYLEEPSKVELGTYKSTGKKVLIAFFKDKYHAIKDFILKLREYNTSTDERMKTYKERLSKEKVEESILKLDKEVNPTNESAFKKCLNEYFETTGCNKGTREERLQKRKQRFYEVLSKFENTLPKQSFTNIMMKGFKVVDDVKSGFKQSSYSKEQDNGLHR